MKIEHITFVQDDQDPMVIRSAKPIEWGRELSRTVASKVSLFCFMHCRGRYSDESFFDEQNRLVLRDIWTKNEIPGFVCPLLGATLKVITEESDEICVVNEN